MPNSNSGPKSKFMGMEFENKINLGEVVTILTTFATIAVMSFGIWKDLYDRTNSNKERIVVVEQQIGTMQIQADKDRADIKDDLKEIKDSLKDVTQIVMENNSAKDR